VTTAPPERAVGAMFDSIVDRYDLVNDVLSLGLDRSWRHALVETVPNGSPVLDLGCGTGRLTRLLHERHVVVGLDVSAEMLRLAHRDVDGAPLVRGSAFALPFPDGTFAAAASAFVLRNLDDLPAAFAELARVVRAGGRASLLDITPPRNALVRRGFDAYFGLVAPAVGSLVGRRDAYRYLVRSVGHLPPPGEVARFLADAGFARVRWRTLFPGTVTLWVADRS
jgi:demethylmenaquinone methyltransferase/2-methoxy-6-polyprenyl-1,4-benzoquinol methylase